MSRICTFTIQLKNPINGQTKFTFGDEQDLENFIKSNLDYFLDVTNSDYKFSKNIQTELIDRLDRVHQSAFDQLTLDREKAIKDFREGKKKAKSKASEEEIPQYSDGYVSVLGLISGGLDSKSPMARQFDLNQWRRYEGDRIRRKYSEQNLPEQEIERLVKEELDAEESSWDYLQNVGRGLHYVLDRVFSNKKRQNTDYLAGIVQQEIQKSGREDLSLAGIKKGAIKSYIQSLYETKDYLEKSSGKTVVKYYPEFVVNYTDDSLKLRGKIDLLVVYDDGTIDIVDLKVSTKNFNYWDADKKQTINYQLAFYKRLLEANGITGKINMKIIPVQALGYNKETGSIERLQFEDIQYITPTVLQTSEVNTIVYADTKQNIITTPIYSDTIEKLSTMFGVSTLGEGFNAANIDFIRQNVKKNAKGYYHR